MLVRNDYIVSTDLDGTLLDHYTYSWKEAQPALNKLYDYDIPVIINTSKTFEEVEEIQRDLGICDPFIVENGSAIYFSKDHFSGDFEGAVSEGEYWIKLFCEKRQVVTEHLQRLRSQYGWKFEGFNDWNIEKIIEKTNLSENDAARALRRDYSEPITWEDTEENFSYFKKSLESVGLRVIKGGRFYHVLGQVNKGKSMQWLAEYYTLCDRKEYKIISLGDGDNDIDMLNVADEAVVVKSPVHDFPKVECVGNVTYTELPGPAGWRDAIELLLKKDSNNG